MGAVPPTIYTIDHQFSTLPDLDKRTLVDALDQEVSATVRDVNGIIGLHLSVNMPTLSINPVCKICEATGPWTLWVDKDKSD
jgi:hypothetical protein